MGDDMKGLTMYKIDNTHNNRFDSNKYNKSYLNRVKSEKNIRMKKNENRVKYFLDQNKYKELIINKTKSINHKNNLRFPNEINKSNNKLRIISADNKNKINNTGEISFSTRNKTNDVIKLINLKKIKADLNRNNCKLFILCELDIHPWNHYSPNKRDILNSIINSKNSRDNEFSSRFETSMGKNLSLSSNFNPSDHPGENNNNNLFSSTEDLYNNIPDYKNKNYDKFLVDIRLNSNKSDDKGVKEEKINSIIHNVENIINRTEEAFLNKNEIYYLKNKYKQVILEYS